MTTIEVKERLRREQNILDRLDNVRRLIEMETTITTVEGARVYVLCPILWSGGRCEECMELFERRQGQDGTA